MRKITLADYFAGYKDHKAITPEIRARAGILIMHVNEFLAELCSEGQCDLDINPITGSLISGVKNGGWRPPDCTEGAWNSSHKEGSGIDIFDLDGDLDNACTDVLLAKHGLYREHPAQTKSWMHLTTRPVKSGRRTFFA
jgi:hypothetical protein